MLKARPCVTQAHSSLNLRPLICQKWKFSISIPKQQKASYYFRLFFIYFTILYMKKMR